MNKVLIGMSAWIANFQWTRDITVAYTGVPVNLLVACLIGAFCSFSVAEKVEPRRKMWGLLIACLFMGAAFTAIANAAVHHWLEMEMTQALQAGMATVISFVTRFALPWIADVARNGKWLSWIPFFRKSE